MVQGLSTSQMGSVRRQGMTQDGRVLYQVTSAEGNSAANISVPREQADVFEKSYDNIMKNAPALEEYAKKYSDPEAMKKQQKKTRWTVLLSTLTGFSIPAILMRKSKLWKQILVSAGSGIAGLLAGTLAVAAFLTPKCVKEFKIAADNLSKIDVRPEQL